MVGAGGGDEDQRFVLDDDFVAGATIAELSADERKREANRQLRRAKRAGRMRRLRRRIRVPAVIALFVLACALGYGFIGQGPLASLKRDDPLAGGPSAVTGSVPGTVPGTGTTVPHLERRSYARGDCVTWDQTADGRYAHDTHVVPCEGPHLIEMTATLTMTTTFDHYPTAEEWRTAIQKDCTGPAEQLLGSKLDPYGRFYAAAIRPSEDSWPAGDRELYCGIQGTDPSARTPTDVLTSFTGKVEGEPQQVLLPVGTCLDDADRAIGCSEAHATEVTAQVDLTGRVTTVPPANDHDGWERLVATECRNALLAYTGQPVSATLHWGWKPIWSESWEAGARVYHCVAGVVTPDRPGWVTTTASLAKKA